MVQNSAKSLPHSPAAIYVPAKLIITGEYSVMHGNTALALPLFSPKLGVSARWHKVQSSQDESIRKEHAGSHICSIEIETYYQNERLSWSTSWQQIEETYQQVYQRQRDFICVNKESKEYSLSVHEFIDCAIYLATHSTLAKAQYSNEAVQIDDKADYQLQLESNIPLGSGLGSSAATVSAILQAINPALNQQQCFQLACQSEDFAHGKSGLLDPWITVYQRPCLWQKAQATSISLRAFNYVLVNTGKPSSSTASCVQQVNQHFPKAHPIWQQIAKISTEIATLMQVSDKQEKQGSYCAEPCLTNEESDELRLIRLIQRNHTLLNEIGVVPGRVAQFISEVEHYHCGAKITGAGSVTGEYGGIVIIFHPCNHHSVIDDISTLVKNYGYTIL